MLIQLSSYPIKSLYPPLVLTPFSVSTASPDAVAIPEVSRGWAGDHPRGRTVPWSREGEANGGEAAPPWGGPMTDARDGLNRWTEMSEILGLRWDQDVFQVIPIGRSAALHADDMSGKVLEKHEERKGKACKS